MKRFRFTQRELGERLIKEARLAREKAERLPPGPEREDLLRKARTADITAHIDKWLASRGLQPPK